MKIRIAMALPNPAMPFLNGLTDEQKDMIRFPWAISPERRRAQGELGHKHYCPNCSKKTGEYKHFSVWAKDIGGGEIEYTLACGYKGLISLDKLRQDQESFRSGYN